MNNWLGNLYLGHHGEANSGNKSQDINGKVGFELRGHDEENLSQTGDLPSHHH